MGTGTVVSKGTVLAEEKVVGTRKVGDYSRLFGVRAGEGRLSGTSGSFI